MRQALGDIVCCVRITVPRFLSAGFMTSCLFFLSFCIAFSSFLERFGFEVASSS